jgi:hypothetical protein
MFGTSRYLFVDMSVAWRTAEAFCVSLDQTQGDEVHTHLAIVNDPGEGLMMGLPTSRDDVWVGLVDRASLTLMPKAENFVWITDEPAAAPLFGEGEPDSTSDAPYCGALDDRFEIDDSGCTTSHPFICECDDFAEVLSRLP